MPSLRLTADSSVIVASLLDWHDLHVSAVDALANVRWAPAHALAESYSSLTAMPRGLSPSMALALLSDAFSEPPVVLSAVGYLDTIRRTAEAGMAGGRIYDALIAATAAEAGARLLTADRRAAATYALVGADFQLIE